MRKSAILAAALAVMAWCAWAYGAATPADDGQSSVPVKIVVLFSSGVGYFEHVGPVRGDSSTELRFKTQQINDILKSLVLQDLGGGRVSTIVYPSQEPISRLLRSFQVDITSNPSLAELLNQLRGAKVRITAGTESIAATILGAEKKPKAVEKGHIEVWAVNLIAGGTIRSVVLDDVTKIELEDARLQEELNKALAALAQARDQDKKPVTIHFKGQGERLVRVGYVVETPVWKTSYRLLLGEKEGGSLQGWAIVENQTDNDWNDVQLSLVSGRPISFIQELYQPLYIPRPVVQPELYASLRPQTYEAGMEKKEKAELADAKDEAVGGFGGGGNRAREARESLKRAAPAGRLAAAAAPRAEGDGRLHEETMNAMSMRLDPAASVASVASAARIGELFQYTVGNVTLPRQRSAMIPIITDPVEVEKLSIYNQNVLPRNPLNGALIKNTTGKHLLAGPVTVLQGSSYAGDARIDNVPPGQQRLLSWGIDLQVLVNGSKVNQTSAMQTGRIVKGVLHLKRKNVHVQEYLAENKDDKDRTLLIEHPLRQGWTLVDTPQPFEKTETLYRFRLAVPAGKSATLTAKEEMVSSETLAILPADTGTLEFYSRAGEIPKEVRDALAKAVSMKYAMVDTQRQLDRIKADLAAIEQDQARIRENVKVAPDKSALKTRLLEKLESQEKQVDALYRQKEELEKTLDAQRKALETFLAGLNIG